MTNWVSYGPLPLGTHGFHMAVGAAMAGKAIARTSRARHWDTKRIVCVVGSNLTDKKRCFRTGENL